MCAQKKHISTSEAVGQSRSLRSWGSRLRAPKTNDIYIYIYYIHLYVRTLGIYTINNQIYILKHKVCQLLIFIFVFSLVNTYLSKPDSAV